MNLFVAYLLCFGMQPSPYIVSHVDGVITRKANQKDTIRPYAKIFDADELIFTPGSKIVAVKGMQVLEMPTTRKPFPTQSLPFFAVMVRDYLLPQTRKVPIYTRGGGAILNLVAMQDHLSSLTENTKPNMLLLDEIRFQLNKQSFGMRDRNYFFLRYLYKGDTVWQKLPYIEPAAPDDPLYVSIQKNFFNKKDIAAIRDMQLFYQFGQVPDPKLIGDLSITLANRADLLAELRILVQEQGSTSGVESYLLTNYGWTDRDDLPRLWPELYR